jgi:hypothetical protein
MHFINGLHITISHKRLGNAALIQVNQHIVYHSPGTEYWDQLPTLNVELAGQMFLKAMVVMDGTSAFDVSRSFPTE